MARRPLSKKKMIPRKEKKTPKPVNPSPISTYEKKKSHVRHTHKPYIYSGRYQEIKKK